MKKKKLTHIDKRGHARMVDVSEKKVTVRTACARATITASRETLALVSSGKTPKGDVLAAVRIAGIQAAKRTPELIPLCHTIALSKVEIDITIGKTSAVITATATANDRTGVEMEALVAASMAALTFYDMLKSVERGMRFTVELLEKTGGRTGTWRADG